MSAIDTLRAQHISQGKCGCCWNQVEKDHPSNARTICSCGQHEPCEVARALDSAIAERDRLRATIQRVRDLADSRTMPLYTPNEIRHALDGEV